MAARRRYAASMAMWPAYNNAQQGRPVRPLCREVLELAGPGAGRTAVDLGCGAGVETAALLAAGWRVYAVDGDRVTVEQLRTVLRPEPKARVVEASFEALTDLPAAGLVHSSYALPFAAPAVFDRLWGLVRERLLPGGWLAVTLFGDRDTWAADPGITVHTAVQARGLLEGLEAVVFREDERDGNAFSGPKHWHTFEIIARG